MLFSPVLPRKESKILRNDVVEDGFDKQLDETLDPVMSGLDIEDP